MSFAHSSPNPRETMSFIKTEIPQAFQVEPRPGGFVNISPIPFPVSRKTREDQVTVLQEPKLKETVSKEFKVQTALDETESLHEEEPTFPNPVNNAMYMFSIAISTLIMMASKHSNIPNDYLQMTKNSLECIKDETGKHPPNVQGILNQLRQLVPTTNDDNTTAARETREGPGGKIEDGGRNTGRGNKPGEDGPEGEGIDLGNKCAGEGERVGMGIGYPGGRNIGRGEGERNMGEKGAEGEVTVKTTTRVTLGRRQSRVR